MLAFSYPGWLFVIIISSNLSKTTAASLCKTSRNLATVYIDWIRDYPGVDERTVRYGCPFGTQFSYFFVASRTEIGDGFPYLVQHCIDGYWNGSMPYCESPYERKIGVSGIDSLYTRNLTVYHNQDIEITFRTDETRFNDEQKILKENGDEITGSYFEEWTRNAKLGFNYSCIWRGRLQHTDTGYFYYQDIDRELVRNDERKVLEWLPYYRIEYFHVYVIPPVHGQWGNWGTWSDCLVTCGEGVFTRFRECDSPAPKYGGDYCVGDPSIDQVCTMPPCPINGSWSEWTDFGDCSATCGGGSRVRTRTCSDPPPDYGGLDCPAVDLSEESEICNTNACAVHGGWSEWNHWNTCSKSCNGGLRSRTRTCNNPVPQHGGSDCEDSSSATESCNVQGCVQHGNWAQWTTWTPCSVSCGFGNQTRERTCTDPTPSGGGNDCPNIDDLESNRQHQTCMDLLECPVDGNWTEWSRWTNCSVHCEGGSNSRYRLCMNPAPAANGKECTGNATEVVYGCNPEKCGVDGGWSEWSLWYLPCSKTCGGGIIYRNRTCDNPVQTYGGNYCSGDFVNSKACNTEDCADGEWTIWSPWSICSASCLGGVQARGRSCTNPRPRFGGKDCPASDPYTQWQRCNVGPCAVHGGWGTWSAWSYCSVTCGGGEQVTTRICNQPLPQYGGHYCIGKGQSTTKCNTQWCPLTGAPEVMTYVPSDTTITVTWSIPVEYQPPILYYQIYYRQRPLIDVDQTYKAVLYLKGAGYPYDIYNLTYFQEMPTRDDDVTRITIPLLNAFTYYQICMTSKYTDQAKVSGHSEVVTVKTLKHPYPAPPSPVTIQLADFKMEQEYKVLIRWTASKHPQYSAPTGYQLFVKDVKEHVFNPWTLLVDVPKEITGYLLRDSKQFMVKNKMYNVKVVAQNLEGSSEPAYSDDIVDYQLAEGMSLNK
ncbi:coadhesin-like isoform X2 [Antedon mediterranea]|uniref:coadhesin-like isoform X2 n=1 Tax=Antedon mediterranea TaxID=105859 RepID=UPI003AF6D581